jgi:hypothetical protein
LLPWSEACVFGRVDGSRERPGQAPILRSDNEKSSAVRWQGNDGIVTEPARGYVWPPFEPGNQAATTHGAGSERRWRPLAEQLVTEALTEAPWLTRPAFSRAVAAWSVAEAKAELVDSWLDDHGLLDESGVPHPANALADRLHARAGTLRTQLGLDPTSFAKLLATFAGVPGGEDALEALKAEGKRLIEARTVAAGPARTTPTTANTTEAVRGPDTALQRLSEAP